MSRIVFISPYRDLSELGRREAEQLNMSVEFHEASMDEAGHVIAKLGDPPVDILSAAAGLPTGSPVITRCLWFGSTPACLICSSVCMRRASLAA